MNKIFFSVLLMHSFICLDGFAQGRSEKQVAAATKTLYKVLLDPDKDVLDNLTAAELSYGHSTGKLDNKSQFIDDLVTGSADFLSIDVSDPLITVIGSTATVRHQLSGKIKDKGKTANLNLHVLLVWVKQKKQWKLLARQASKI